MKTLIENFDRTAYLKYVREMNEELREKYHAPYAKANRSDKKESVGHKHSYYFLTKNTAYRLRMLILQHFPKVNVELKTSVKADKAQKDLFVTPKLEEFPIK